MENIVSYFEETFGRRDISNTERKKLIQMINSENPDRHKRNFLRRKIFDLALNSLENSEDMNVINWLEKANKVLILKEDSQSKMNEVYFSPGTDCFQAINYRLRRARKSVKVCVFTISDNRISDVLIDCFKRGIRVQVLTDNDKLFDPGSDVKGLLRAGLEIRVDYSSHHMHHKFAVIDNEIAITGSYNWTRSAAEYNQENLFITDEISVVEAYNKEFNKLWNKMKEIII